MTKYRTFGNNITISEKSLSTTQILNTFGFSKIKSKVLVKLKYAVVSLEEMAILQKEELHCEILLLILRL